MPLALPLDDDPIPTVGEQGADFRAFFATHHAYVASVGLAVLGSRDELEDLMQEVFILAHRHRHRVREPGAIRGWLATITVREARRRLRKRRVRSFVGLGPVEEDELEPPEGVVGDEAALDVLRARALERALDRLPIELRMAWVLRVEGYELGDVARMCECSLATVKRRIARAQTRLERRLSDGP